jgi:hypothetical protein
MTPEEIAQDRAVIAAASGGTWATYSPREQGGGPVLASFGTTVDTPDVLVQIRQSRPAPQTDAEFTALVTERLSTPWAQHEANARFAVTAHERWPAYIAAAEEVNRRVAAILAEERVTRLRAQRYPERSTERAALVGHADGLAEAANILRGSK